MKIKFREKYSNTSTIYTIQNVKEPTKGQKKFKNLVNGLFSNNTLQRLSLRKNKSKQVIHKSNINLHTRGIHGERADRPCEHVLSSMYPGKKRRRERALLCLQTPPFLPEQCAASTVTPGSRPTIWRLLVGDQKRQDMVEMGKWNLAGWTSTTLKLKKPQRSFSTVSKMPFHKLTILTVPKSSFRSICYFKRVFPTLLTLKAHTQCIIWE